MPSTVSYLTQEALGGLSAGIIGTLIGYPLDVLKTRMQTGETRNGISVLASILRMEGMSGLYKGVGPPLLSLSILNTMSFTSYSYFRESFGGSNGWDYRNGLAGMMGAPAFAMISTLENRLKTQMQLYSYQNSLECAQTLVRNHGVLSLYTGHVVNTAREAVFVSTYFFVYEGMKEGLVNGISLSPKTAIPVAGGIAGATSWAVSFPLDCVRAGVQGQLKSTGSIGVARELVRKHGIAGLYNGVWPSIARAFLVSGSRFSAYEGAVWLVRGGKYQRDD